LVMTCVDLTTVKELLGHKDIKMMFRYAHLAPAHKWKAVNVLDILMNPYPNCTPTMNCTITAQKTEKELADPANSLKFMVGDAGFEPATPAV